MRLQSSLVLLTSLLASISLTSAKSFSKSKDAVKLSSVRSLTLRAGKSTSHRRVSAIPQLQIIGGNAKGLYDVDVMRCTNSGSEYDAEDIQWTCKASLPSEFKLGSTDVICEGYDNPDDPFVLKGSCGVEYTLVLTPEGENVYPDRVKTGWRSMGKSSSGGGDDVGGVATFFFWLFFLFVLGVIVYSVWSGGDNTGGNRRRRRTNRGGFGGGGGGGGHDGGSDDPPPPYTPRAPKTAPQSSSNTNEQWRPGFWSGTAAGAAAGYGASQWANRNNRNQRNRAGPSSWFGGRGHESYTEPGNSGWFGGGGGGGYGGSGGFGAGPSSASRSSGGRHESTGFGGTRRR